MKISIRDICIRNEIYSCPDINVTYSRTNLQQMVGDSRVQFEQGFYFQKSLYQQNKA